MRAKCYPCTKIEKMKEFVFIALQSRYYRSFCEMFQETSIKLLCLFVIFAYFMILGSANTSGSELLNNYAWNDCGGINWYPDLSIGHNSTSSLRSGTIENTGISRLCMKVNGPSEIGFWWKTDANYYRGVGQFSFFVDGIRKYMCDSRDWEYKSYSLRGNDSYTLTWEFVKFKTYPKNTGAGWIDGISVDGIEYITKSNTASVVNQRVIIDGNLSEDTSGLHKWRKIEDGIKDAYESNADQILIKNGIYYLNNTLYINKPMIIQGETKEGVILRPMENNRLNGIYVYSSGSTIDNITLDGFSISLDIYGSNNKILNNIIYNTENGVIATGTNNLVISGNCFNVSGSSDVSCIAMMYATGATISGNSFKGMRGIWLDECKEATIEENDLLNITHQGISLSNSNDVKVCHNNLRDCSANYYVDDDKNSKWISNYWQNLTCKCVSGLSSDRVCSISQGSTSIFDPHPLCTKNGWRPVT